MTFVDTSALYSLIDIEEVCHDQALRTWNDLLRSETPLTTTNYVLLETAALLQRRIGLKAVRFLHDEIVPVLQVDWISEEAHMRGIEAALFAGRRKLSIVDCVSFVSMRRHHATTAFTFDDHFREQGFTLVP